MRQGCTRSGAMRLQIQLLLSLSLSLSPLPFLVGGNERMNEQTERIRNDHHETVCVCVVVGVVVVD